MFWDVNGNNSDDKQGNKNMQFCVIKKSHYGPLFAVGHRSITGNLATKELIAVHLWSVRNSSQLKHTVTAILWSTVVYGTLYSVCAHNTPNWKSVCSGNTRAIRALWCRMLVHFTGLLLYSSPSNRHHQHAPHTIQISSSIKTGNNNKKTKALRNLKVFTCRNLNKIPLYFGPRFR